MNQHRTILVGMDFSPASASALRQALRIAAWNQASVKVVHVIETLVMTNYVEAMSALMQDVVQALEGEARTRWQAFLKLAPGAQKLPFDIEINSSVAALSRRSSEAGVGLLVLGTKGRGTGRGAGPVASGCVRRATCDVLLVQDPHVQPYSTVVVGIDFSETSRRALEQGTRVALQDSATLYVVHAYTSPLGQRRGEKPGLEDAIRAAMMSQLEEFARPLAHEMGYLKAEYKLIQEKVSGHGIGEFAAQIGADLVVVGKRGKTNLRDVLLGSTAERVLRDAPCSILTVKPAG